MGVPLPADVHRLDQAPVGLASERLAAVDRGIHLGGGAFDLPLEGVAFLLLVVEPALLAPVVALDHLVDLTRLVEGGECGGHLVEHRDGVAVDEGVGVELALELDHPPDGELEAE